MNRRSSKWIRSAVAAGLLLSISLAGCGAPSSSSQSAGGSSSGGSNSSTASGSSTGAPVKLKFFSELNGKSANTVTSYKDVKSMQELEKLANVEIEWQHPPIGQEKEQFNLMVASQNLPDMIWWDWSTYPGGPEKAIADKVIIKLNDQMASAPNLNGVYDKYPTLKKQASTDSSTLYMFPFIREMCLNPDTEVLNYFMGPSYRKDLADKAGVTEPQTIDDWYKMLTAFKKDNPNCIPFSATQKSTDGTSIYALCAPFGVLNNFYMEGDKISHGLLSPKFKTYVETMAKWYAEGLIDKDFLANDGNAFKAKVTNGDVGAFIGSQGGNYVSFSKVMETSVPGAMLQTAPWPAGPDGKAYTGQGAVNHIVGGSGVAITPKNANVEASMRYLDYGYGKEGIDLLNFGLKDVTYEVKGDEYVWTDSIKKQMDEKGVDFIMGEYAFGGINSWATFQAIPLTKLTRTYRGQYESSLMWGKASNALIAPPVTPTTEEATKMADIVNQVTTYRDEMIGKMIMGQVPLSEYDTVLENAKKMGLEEAVAIENAALERYKAR